MREVCYAVTVIKKWQHNSRMLFANFFYPTLEASDNGFTLLDTTNLSFINERFTSVSSQPQRKPQRPLRRNWAMAAGHC